MFLNYILRIHIYLLIRKETSADIRCMLLVFHVTFQFIYIYILYYIICVFPMDEIEYMEKAFYILNCISKI